MHFLARFWAINLVFTPGSMFSGLSKRNNDLKLVNTICCFLARQKVIENYLRKRLIVVATHVSGVSFLVKSEVLTLLFALFNPFHATGFHTSGFLFFSGSIERDQWHEMG